MDAMEQVKAAVKAAVREGITRPDIRAAVEAAMESENVAMRDEAAAKLWGDGQ